MVKKSTGTIHKCFIQIPQLFTFCYLCLVSVYIFIIYMQLFQTIWESWRYYALSQKQLQSVFSKTKDILLYNPEQLSKLGNLILMLVDILRIKLNIPLCAKSTIWILFQYHIKSFIWKKICLQRTVTKTLQVLNAGIIQRNSPYHIKIMSIKFLNDYY